jgi:mannose-6-phosphate isomerase-like protein (cupin superfamily)
VASLGFFSKEDTAMTIINPQEVLVLGPDAGEQLRFLGASTMSIKSGDVDVTFYEYVSEPGVEGPPQHIHHGHDETFYVVQGHYEFTLGRDVISLPEGSFLRVPRDTPHTFRNSGTGPGRIVGTFNPGRFADYFRELAAIITATGAPPQPAAWAELYARYDSEFFEPSQ